MDIEEKRVVRRKTPIIAQAIVFQGSLATAAIKQGLVSEAESLAIQANMCNRSRVTAFLQSLESLPGPRVAFEKLCFLLEHQGHSWLCDELWVELICEKGNLPIEPTVYAEAKMLVRQRLEKKTALDDKDLEELTLLIATRYQVAKETFRRQASRSTRQKTLDKMVIQDDIRDLCSQIDRCMTVSSKTLYSRVDSGISQSVSEQTTIATTPSAGGVIRPVIAGTPSAEAPTPSLDQEGPPIPSLDLDATQSRLPFGKTKPEAKELTTWVHSLKSKISNFTNAYVSRVVKDANRQHRKKKISGDHVEEGYNSEGDKSSDDGDTMDSAYYDEISERQIKERRQQRASAKSGRTQTGLPLHISNKTVPPETKYSILDKYKVSRCHTAGGRLEGASSIKPSRRRRRKKRSDYDKSDMVDVNIQLTEADRQKTDHEIWKDIQELRKKQAVLKSRQSLGGTLLPKDMPELEKLFWEKKAESMAKCRSVGYYYFLSSFKNDRCYACAVGPEKRVKCAWSAKSKHTRNTSPTVKMPSNLYDNRSWTCAGSDDIDDTHCPGAFPHPKTGEKRCLACAYANKDLPSFYDAVVAPDGSRHFEYPHSKTTYRKRKDSAPVIQPPRVFIKKTVRINHLS